MVIGIVYVVIDVSKAAYKDHFISYLYSLKNHPFSIELRNSKQGNEDKCIFAYNLYALLFTCRKEIRSVKILVKILLAEVFGRCFNFWILIQRLQIYWRFLPTPRKTFHYLCSCQILTNDNSHTWVAVYKNHHLYMSSSTGPQYRSFCYALAQVKMSEMFPKTCRYFLYGSSHGYRVIISVVIQSVAFMIYYPYYSANPVG